MEKKRLTLFIFLLIILFATFGASVDTSVNSSTFKARLAGSKELPPVQTKAHGEVTFQLSITGEIS